jgi:pimeloyl-ACP methyl ester carboxylesterase
MNTLFAKLAATFVLAMAMISPAAAETANINGLSMFYEEHGLGEPLVLLHGAYMNNGNWASMVPTLARTHRVTGAGLIGVRGS